MSIFAPAVESRSWLFDMIHDRYNNYPPTAGLVSVKALSNFITKLISQEKLLNGESRILIKFLANI